MSLPIFEFPGDLSRSRIRRPPVERVSVSKDLTGEDSPSILLALFLVLPVWIATRDCSEPRVQSR